MKSDNLDNRTDRRAFILEKGRMIEVPMGVCPRDLKGCRPEKTRTPCIDDISFKKKRLNAF